MPTPTLTPTRTLTQGGTLLKTTDVCTANVGTGPYAAAHNDRPTGDYIYT